MLRYGLIRGLPLWVAPLLAVGLAFWPRLSSTGAQDPADAARVALFGSLGGLLLMLIVVRACLAGRDLGQRDRTWLAPRPTAPLGPLTRFLAGLAAAWTLAVLGLGVGAQLGVERRAADWAAGTSAGEPSEPALRQAGPLAGPELVLLAPGSPTTAWLLEDPAGRLPAHGGLTFLARVLGGAGPSSELTVELTRRDTGAATTTRRALAGTRRVAAPLPAGAGPVEVRLGYTGAPLRLNLAEAFAFEPVPQRRLASLTLTLRLWLLGLGALGLGLGLGTHLRASIAAPLVLAVGLAGLDADLLGALRGVVGTGAWARALETTGEGWVAGASSAAEWAGAGLGLLAGLGLAWLTLRRQKR
ncbi:MAG: hypothetical protein P1V81_13095 [Planctomycetota bacterium]|nr:hypothetical protein [Planctomycetota bacterium]